MRAAKGETRLQRVLVLVGISVLAFNLRPAAVSVGPVLDEIHAGLHLSTGETALLTSLPVLAFAIFGALAPRLARAVGPHRATLAALAALTAGLWLRAQVGSALVFLLLSLAALGGMAVANVLLPSLVKLHFPDRIGLVTALYSTFLSVGLTAGSVLTVPIAERGAGAGDPIDWRLGLVAWAVTAALALLPWLALVRHDMRAQPATKPIPLSAVFRTRTGWSMAAFFGLQSTQAYVVFGWFAKVYRDAGFSASTAGLLLGTITAISIPLSFVVPALTASMHDKRILLSALMAAYPVGYLGLVFAPVAGAWVWAVAVGVGTCTFPFILTMIGLRARTPEGTAALSGFTQATGYLISAAGPFGIGLLHGATGGWTVPLWTLTGLLVPQYLVGLAAAGRGYLEDELDPAGPGRTTSSPVTANPDRR